MGKNPGAASEVAGEVMPDQQEEQQEGLLDKPLGRVGAMAAVTIAYVALLDVIGYIPATILGMAAALWVLQARGLRGLLLGPVVMSVGLYLTFTYLLSVRLP